MFQDILFGSRNLRHNMYDCDISQEFSQYQDLVDAAGTLKLNFSSNSLSDAIRRLEFSWSNHDTTFHQ